MITLSDLVDCQKLTGKSDIELIREFFIQNDLEESAIELISELTKAKITKLKQKHSMSEMWASFLPSEYLYEEYDLDTATWLHRLELNYISRGGELSKQFMELAKERVPETKMPQIYFQPLIEYMEKRGIKFKDCDVL